VFGRILVIFSYVYHVVLALFLLAISAVSLIVDLPLQLRMLPWTGAALTYWLLGLSAVGVISVALAVRGTFRWLFALYAIVALVLIVRGFFFSSFSFRNAEQFQDGALFTFAGLGAMFGALKQARHQPGRDTRWGRK
jgi:hypothetical protein